ncbi:MAG: hypothetical protein L0H41_15245 [Microlunatus sp.]|nr:hypothetical protein [Microlunatus sp.]MDN5770748.1 hypothetical protein [Microlunatus sp.]MDN5805346.1 hypothetical protein [Microlunatus sp.]
MGRLFWVAVGAGVTVYVVVKVRKVVRTAGPEAVAGKVQHAIEDAIDEAKAFAGRYRAASAEREAELRETFGLTQ